MRLLAVLKSVLVLLLNMYNILEISGLFVHQGELVKIFNAWVGQKKKKKMLGCGLLHGSIPTLTQWFITNYSFQFCSFFCKLKFGTDGTLLKAYFELPKLEFILYL